MIAMLSSIPGLLGPISQWQSSDLIGKYSRKKIIMTAVLFEILSWIPLVLLALLYYFGVLTSIIPLMLLIFFSIYVISANAGSPAWFSWIGDLVDEEYRGRWFAKRTFILGAAALISSILSALMLDYMKKNNLLLIGFVILFVIAMVSRGISRYFISKQYEPKLKIEEESYFSFFEFITKAPFNNFGRFSIYRALLNSATAIAGPFFTIYMLRSLNFSYVTFIIVTAAATLFQLMAIKAWGRFSDKYGNYEVFRITLILIALCPITWIFSGSPIYLILVPQVLSGIGWGGFNLACSNYVFDCVTPQKRCLAFSYYELLNGIGIFIGAGIGAILIDNIKTNFLAPILVIFIISGIMRLIVGMIMIPKIKEVKDKEKFTTKKGIKIITGKIKRPIFKEIHLFKDHIISPLFYFEKK